MNLRSMAFCAALALQTAPLRADAPKTSPGLAAPPVMPAAPGRQALPPPPSKTDSNHEGVVDGLAILENEVQLSFHSVTVVAPITFARSPHSEAWIETLKYSLRNKKKLGVTIRKLPGVTRFQLLRIYEDR